MVDYSVAKAGVISLTKSLAKELAHSGINVNAVAPSITKTELIMNLAEEAQRKSSIVRLKVFDDDSWAFMKDENATLSSLEAAIREKRVKAARALDDVRTATG